MRPLVPLLSKFSLSYVKSPTPLSGHFSTESSLYPVTSTPTSLLLYKLFIQELIYVL